MMSTLVVLAMFVAMWRRVHRRRLARHRRALAKGQAAIWAVGQVCVVLDTMIYATHPYNTRSVARLYQHFERRRTLDEIEAMFPPGALWLSQFRFERR